VVEHLLAKEKAAGSNPVFRSSTTRAPARVFSMAAGKSFLSSGRDGASGRGGMADAAVLKTAEGQPSCGFESRRPHQFSLELSDKLGALFGQYTSLFGN
jgi:hypothetical protein